MRKKNKKEKWLKRTAGVLVLVVFLSFSPSSGRAMEAWPSFKESTFLAYLLEQLRAIRSALTGAAKSAALKQMNSLVRGKITGGGGEDSLVIVNYDDFIYKSAKKSGQKMLEKFFTKFNKDLPPEMREVTRSVEEAIREELEPEFPKSVLQDLIQSDDVYADMFNQAKGGGIDAYWKMLQTGADHPAHIYENTRKMIEKEIEKQIDLAKTEAMAGLGFKTKVEDGKAVPGSTASLLAAAAEAAPIDNITNATDLEQVLASMATSLVSSFFDKGFGVISSQAKNQLDRIDRAVQGGSSAIQESIYQGSNLPFGDLIYDPKKN